MRSGVPFPIARRAGVEIAIRSGRIHVGGHELPPLAALLWKYADGSRSPTRLAEDLSARLGRTIDIDSVWSGLDRLADVGLLQRRITPPGSAHGWSRREVLHVAAVAILAGEFPSIRPAPALADEPAPHEESPSADESIDELRRQELRALDEARAARQRGDGAAAAAHTERAKEASRKRSELERRGEQEAKDQRHQEIDAARPRRATPEATRAEERGPLDRRPGSRPTTGVDSERDRQEHAPSVPATSRDDRREFQQEQELKNTQERNQKRLRVP